MHRIFNTNRLLEHQYLPHVILRSNAFNLKPIIAGNISLGFLEVFCLPFDDSEPTWTLFNGDTASFRR